MISGKLSKTLVLFLLIKQFICITSYIIAKTYPYSKEDDLNALKETLEHIRILPAIRKICRPESFGEVYGAHKLCSFFENAQFPCYFFSFGIETDYTFDRMLHNRYNCSGYAFDPTVDYPTDLLPGVKFIKAGANSPVPPTTSTYHSVPKLRKQLGHPLFALKMDCEGCEYSLAQDILADDPDFFLSILQFSFELHLPRAFANTEEDVYSLGRLFRLLQLSGMRLVHVDDGRCGHDTQRQGCHELLDSIGFPCEPGCRSYLFAHNYLSAAAWLSTYQRIHGTSTSSGRQQLDHADSG